VAFVWPVLLGSGDPAGDLAHAADAPWVFTAMLPLLVAVVMVEMGGDRLDAKSIALLGVLAASGAVLRLPSPAVAGLELVFFLVVLSGRVLGAGFGFVLGALTLFVSALLTGGVGPWLPFQMLATAWVGAGAGMLPRASGRREIVMLAGYTAAACLAYGLLMNLWFWPFGAAAGTEVSFLPGAGTAENLRRFWGFHLATSFGFDVPRAVLNAALVVVTGPAVLAALRRATRRAAFDAPVSFGAGEHEPEPDGAAR
jgi:energy-coupling factor transport system substrate-specific component